MSPQSKKFRKHRKNNNLGKKSPTARSVRPLFLIGLASGLSLFGLVMIYNVSSLSAMTDFGDQYYYVKEQIQWVVIGSIGMMFFTFFDYRRLYNFALPLLLVSIGLLFAVFIPGLGINALGASRWINFGIISLQPTEFVKLAITVYLSAWFTNKEKKRLSSFLLLMVLVIGPILLQPDLGSASIIVALAVSIYFLSGAPLSQFLLMIPAFIAGIAYLAISAPYRLARVKTFFNIDADPQGGSYHVRQILIALGTGGWFGLGLGQSRQKYAYLPEVSTDSIFAIISEELGFFGASLLLFAFFSLLMQAFRIARNAHDRFGYILASGIVVALTFQVFLNLGAIVSLVPLTGTPLPFISYGGSNIIISFCMIGILANIARSRP